METGGKKGKAWGKEKEREKEGNTKEWVHNSFRSEKGKGK